MAENDNVDAHTATPETPTAPRGLALLKSTGPGLLVAMAWLGTGDLIDSSVSGANYGYALMWALALALVTKYVYASSLAKYQLCNREGHDSIFDGFRSLWRWYPLLLGVGAIIAGFVMQTYISRALGTSLYHLSGEMGGPEWGVFLWTSIVCVLTILLTFSKQRQYKVLEIVAHVAAAVLVVTFVGTALVQGFDVGKVVSGLTYSTPEDKGMFGSLLVAVALLGAVGSSIGTLLYPEFIRDKGWRGPQFLRVQRIDLMIGIVATIVINCAIWIVAAEAANRGNFVIEGEGDLAKMMTVAVGQMGPTLLWIGIMFITVSTYPAYGRVYANLLLQGVHKSVDSRGARYSRPDADPAFPWLQYGLLYILPVSFALPYFPDMVVLTVVGSSVSGFLAPLVIVGALILTSNKRRMLDGYANKWWETAALTVVLVTALWASYGIIKGIADLAGKL